MEKQEFEIITTQRPHYPTSCRVFLKNAMPLDEIAQQLLVGTAFATMPGSQEANAAGKQMARHMGRLLADISYPLKQASWAAVSTALPAMPVKKFCSDRIDSLSEEFANARATYLSGLLHPLMVAQALPQSLRSEHAAAYMHFRRRYGLKAVIETALDLNG